MSLARTALRLTTMEALRPSTSVGGDGPWPTIGGKFIFDSRIDPVDDLKANEKLPIAVVYTEEDNGDPGQHAGGPPFKRIVDVLIDLSVVALVTEDGNNFAAGTPITDAELEASLDLFEAQIRFALMYGPTGNLWRLLTGRRVTDISSLPHRTSEESARLAMRSLRMKCVIPDDDYVPAPATAPAGNDRLPEPLKSVIAALASTSYGAKIGAGLAAAASTMPVKTPLNEVTLDLQPGDPPGAHDVAKPQVNAAADNLQD